jgi:hypothetical protein
LPRSQQLFGHRRVVPRYTGTLMRRTALLVTLLIAMLWQSVAMARPGSSINALADSAHAALHLAEEGHHHHDDGSFHLDESIESVQHLMADHASAATALLAMDSTGVPHAGSESPEVLRAHTRPQPFLDGLLRPPRIRA